jgi:hypothetical protein
VNKISFGQEIGVRDKKLASYISFRSEY